MFLFWACPAAFTHEIVFKMTRKHLSHNTNSDNAKFHIYPPQQTDMSEEMRVEAMELCVTACEKFVTNNEVSSHCHLGEADEMLTRSPL